MTYFLISKFQGAYLGQIIGKQLLHKNQLINDSLSDYLIKNNQVISAIISSINNDLAIWQKCFLNSNSLRISDIALSLLPWILLYHDNWHQLQYLIYLVSQKTNLDSEDREILEFWIYQVVLALRGKIDLDYPIEQIIQHLQLQSASNLKQLEIIAVALAQGQSSKQVIEILLAKINYHSRIELLLSLYLFLSVPEAFPLIMQRAIVVAQKFPNTVSLTSTLGGAYNSVAGISPYWLNYSQNQQEVPQSLLMIKKLFNFWLGAYHYDKHDLITSVIAIPNTLQPRPGLKIISQAEYRSN
jgi:hypothetical protein